MSKLTPIDMAFLLLENPSRQMHMAAYQLFRLPPRQKTTFIPKLLAAYRASAVGKPFNQKLVWLDKSVASWVPADADPRYHIRHIAVPAPGAMEDFYGIVSFLNTPLLDRARPLWECYVIEGIEDDQFAVFIKVHHALIDGMGALKLFDKSLNTSAADKTLRAVWMPFDKAPVKRKQAGKPQLQQLIARLGKLPSAWFSVGSGVVDLGAQNLCLKPQTASLPFGAKQTLFNNTATSSERRYANCEIALAIVKDIAKTTGTTVNDVVMTLIDDALHAYLKEHDATTPVPLVAVMAMSIRSADQAAAGNQVSVELVPMGEPEAAIMTRLQQMHESTSKIKQRSSKLPNSVRQLYSLLITGTTTLPDIAAAFKSIPSGNLVISNMIGPQKQLYLGGAPMVAFQGLPIVPPGGGLNVSFATVNTSICLAVGAAPEAVEDPYHLTRLIMAALTRLQQAVAAKKPARKTSARTSRGKKK